MLPINAVILQRNGSRQGVTHPGAPLGWVLAHRTEADNVRYFSLFVAPGHRSRARGMACWLRALDANTMVPFQLLALPLITARQRSCACSSAISAFTSTPSVTPASAKRPHFGRVSMYKQQPLAS